MIRCAVSLAIVLASPAAGLEPVLDEGEELEVRLDADFNGDGLKDIAYVTRSEDGRNLVVSVAEHATEYLPLETTPLGAGSLTFANGVLAFEDLTGGTTAYSTTRRYRYDDDDIRMRLIGFDTTLYSRTYAHDGFDLSWNLLTGKLITRELRLNRKGGAAAYEPTAERVTRRKSGKVWLFDTPDPEELLEAVRKK